MKAGNILSASPASMLTGFVVMQFPRNPKTSEIVRKQCKLIYLLHL
jgi:hypothetical protein